MTEFNPDDLRFIRGLKSSDADITHEFFYGEIGGILRRIRAELFKGAVGMDEMVGELYLYLSKDSWRRLDGFTGASGCRLRSWMIPVAWRFFMAARARMTVGLCTDSPEESDATTAPVSEEEMRIQIAIDVKAVIERMPNRRYAEILRLLIVEGYTPAETAGMLGIRVENVYNLKHRAISQFAEIYGRR